MSLVTVNGEIITETKIQSITLRPVLGGYELVFGIHLCMNLGEIQDLMFGSLEREKVIWWAVRHESGSNEFLCVHVLKAHNLIEILWILHIRKDVWHETHAKICSS